MKKSRAIPLTVATRDVYSLEIDSEVTSVEASSLDDLRRQLTSLLSIDTHSIQAVARLAYVERVTLIAPAWTIRHLGSLQFVANPAVPSVKAALPAPTTAHPTVVSSLPGWLDNSNAANLTPPETTALTAHPTVASSSPGGIADGNADR